jgi:hypothetical protein
MALGQHLSPLIILQAHSRGVSGDRSTVQEWVFVHDRAEPIIQ